MDPLDKGFDMNLGGQNYLDRIMPRFHMRAIYMEEESEEKGTAIYKDYPYVEFITPGDRRSVPDLRVTEQYKKQWPKQWEAFQAGVEYTGDGRPLSEWPAMPGSMVKMLATIHIFTVEQFVDAQVDNIRILGPGFLKMHEVAVRFLSDNDTKQEQIDDLKGENESLVERIKALENAVKEKVSSSGKRPTVKPQAKRAENAKDSTGDSK